MNTISFLFSKNSREEIHFTVESTFVHNTLYRSQSLIKRRVKNNIFLLTK